MKTKNFFATLILGTTFSVFAVSCDDDDYDKGLWVSPSVHATFEQMYPEAKRVDWDSEGAYTVASFRTNVEYEVWFGKEDGLWKMTEIDLRYSDLPEVVRMAHESGEYFDWRKDDIDLIERPDVEPVYIIDVEKRVDGREMEYELHYSADGVLLKAEQDLDGGAAVNPQLPILTPAIQGYVAEHYPNARIADVDREGEYVEVEVIVGSVKHDVFFNSSSEWVSTSTDVRVSQLPASIVTFLASNYPNYSVDDADYVETPSGTWYELELENRQDHEIFIRVTENGELLQN